MTELWGNILCSVLLSILVIGGVFVLGWEKGFRAGHKQQVNEKQQRDEEIARISGQFRHDLNNALFAARIKADLNNSGEYMSLVVAMQAARHHLLDEPDGARWQAAVRVIEEALKR
jgi:hypothetical protein